MKDVESIRRDLGMSQTEFASLLNNSLRTYQGRLDGSQPKWLLSEIVTIAKNNNNRVKVHTLDGTYEITIKEVDE